MSKYSTDSLGSERKLAHRREMGTSNAVEAHAHELKHIQKDLLDCGNLHASTGVFDVAQLPALPGFGRFGCGGGSAKGDLAILRLEFLHV